jgi:CheY-like chemotaxis protein
MNYLRRKYNIAVVEDEGIVAMDIRKSLQLLGYNVAFVSDSGEKAIVKLNELKADLVLMDVVLKGKMDGIDAAKIIINEMNIPIVFVTAFEDESTRKRTERIKNYGYLTKPFEDFDLKTVIENALKDSCANLAAAV